MNRILLRLSKSMPISERRKIKDIANDFEGSENILLFRGLSQVSLEFT